VLITRLEPEKADAVNGAVPITYYPVPGIGLFGEPSAPSSAGVVAVAAAGTSDLPVAEEAAITAETLGNRVERFYDVGVAGLHRLLSKLDSLMSARVIVAVAGMEGALATVIGGLVACPVIAVPTSVGYGANFGGLSALLSMLNSCAGNVSVVNIDNGFGAGYLASIINRIGER
jgi:NCAIR mutase (PurE)-related protein